jgi:hypothetical protein
MDGTVEAFLGAARAHAEHGTTSMIPTTLTCPDEELFLSFEVFREACRLNENGAQMLGMHLEGPYFNHKQAGAQDPLYLKNPTPEHYNEIIEKGADVISRWSAAVELEGADGLGEALKEHGIVASIAHTDAVYDEIVPTVTNGGENTPLAPDMITILPQAENYSYTYTVMTTVDLNANQFSPVTSSVLGSGDNVYCTKDNLYIVETKYIEEKTDYGNGRVAISTGGLNTVIHRFSLEDSAIRAEATGEVKGRTLNQFSVDEKGGFVHS